MSVIYYSHYSQEPLRIHQNGRLPLPEVFHVRAKLYKNAYPINLVNQVIESFVNNVLNGVSGVDKEPG